MKKKQQQNPNPEEVKAHYDKVSMAKTASNPSFRNYHLIDGVRNDFSNRKDEIKRGKFIKDLPVERKALLFLWPLISPVRFSG